MLTVSGRVLAVATGAVSLAALVALAWSVRDGFAGLDLLDARATAMRVGAVDLVLDTVDLAGSLPVWAALVGLITIFLGRGRWRVMGEALSVVVLAEVAATAVKIVVARARPPMAEVGDLIVAAGFPSGHVMRAAVLVGVVLFLLATDARGRRAVFAVGLSAVVVMGVARVSAGAHYTSDVLGALLLSSTILAGWELLSPHHARVVAVPKPMESGGRSEDTDLAITAQPPR